jgi:hypothetical protein
MGPPEKWDRLIRAYNDRHRASHQTDWWETIYSIIRAGNGIFLLNPRQALFESGGPVLSCDLAGCLRQAEKQMKQWAQAEIHRSRI